MVFFLGFSSSFDWGITPLVDFEESQDLFTPLIPDYTIIKMLFYVFFLQFALCWLYSRYP